MWAISSELLGEIYSGRDWILLMENKYKQRDRPGRRSEEKEVIKGAFGALLLFHSVHTLLPYSQHCVL